MDLECQEEDTLTLVQMNRKLQILKDLLILLDEEELYWYKRSHGKWIHEGGNNTNFFHRVANGRKRSNTIINFVNDGVIVEGDENLLQHAIDYYKNLFGVVNEVSCPINPEMWRA